MIHLFAHNNKNYIKVGDKVKAYDDYIGEIGNAYGSWYAHLHYSVSDGLTPAQLKAYINGWSKDKVLTHYKEPNVDRDKMFSEPVDNGQAGYDWLQWIGNGYHPGRDYNGFGGGNTDIGYKFKSPVDGQVIYSGNWGGGWGNIILIDDTKMEKTYYIKSELRNELKGIWSKFDHEDKDDHKKMAEKLNEHLVKKDLLLDSAASAHGELIEKYEKLDQANLDMAVALDTARKEVALNKKTIEIQNETIEGLEERVGMQLADMTVKQCIGQIVAIIKNSLK